MKNSYVPNEKGKKITAAITAVAILVGGTLIAKLSTKDKNVLKIIHLLYLQLLIMKISMVLN